MTADPLDELARGLRMVPASTYIVCHPDDEGRLRVALANYGVPVELRVSQVPGLPQQGTIYAGVLP